MHSQTKNQLQNYLKFFYSKRWFIVSFVVLSVGIALVFLHYARKEYLSSAVILIDEDNKTTELDIFSKGQFGSKIKLQNHIEHLRSFSISENVYNYLKQNQSEYPILFEIFNPLFKGTFPTEVEKILWLRRRVSIELLNRKSDMIKISFRSYQPDEAKYIANAYVKIYKESNLKLNRSELLRLNRYIIAQIADKESKLNQAEDALNKFKQEEGIKYLKQQTSSEIERFSDMKAQRESAKIDLEAALASKKALEIEIKKNKSNLTSKGIEFSSAYFTKLSEKIAAKRARKTDLETRLKSNNISFETFKQTLDQLDTQIKELEKELSSRLATSSKESIVNDPFKLNEEMRRKFVNLTIDIKANQKRISSLDGYLSRNKIETSNLPSKQLRLIRLQRDAKIFEKVYDFLVEKKNETEIKISAEKNEVKIIDRARINLNPIYPKKTLIVFMFFFGSIALSTLLLYAIEYFDNTIKSEDEIKHYNIENLGMVPAMDSLDDKKNKDITNENKFRLISHLDPNSIVTESYRSIRTNLIFKAKQYNIKSFLFTSCGPQEGKSTTIVNIGISFAQTGSKVVIVDSDLRRPVIHSVFNVKKNTGLSTYLLGEATISEIIQATSVDNVFAITSGLTPPNPSELLSVEKVDILTEELKSRFDIILFDTPPVIAVTDATILAEKVDKTILVFRANKTDRDLIAETKSKLISSSNNLLGCVLNDFNFERHYGYKYKYYGYYNNEK